MTEQDLEIIRVNIRVAILRSLIGNILVALSRLHPVVAQTILKGFEADPGELAFEGVNAAQSDMLSSERREEIEEMRSYLQSVLRA